MFQNLQDCLMGKTRNYHLPFLWLHGESKERIREEIIAIRNSGIYEFCAESRPYDAFCQDPWWEDFGYILQTAKELGMSQVQVSRREKAILIYMRKAMS